MGIEIRISASGVVHVETSRSYTECGEEAEKVAFRALGSEALKTYVMDALEFALPRRKEEADAPIPAEPDMDLTGVWTDSAPPPISGLTPGGTCRETAPPLKPRDPAKKVVTIVPEPADATTCTDPVNAPKVELPPVFPKTPPAPEKGQF